jgi:archaeosine synthase beta-subunit
MTASAPKNAERAARTVSRARLDPFRPQAFFVEAERSAAGDVVSVATVFLTNRECPWQCIYCDLWKNTTIQTVPAGAIPAQIDLALTELGDGSCRQIKLYNAGSFFDPNAIPPDDFPAIANHVRGFERVIVECHPALIGESAVRFRDLLSPLGTQLEIALGLEVSDDALLAKLNKRMTLAMFEGAAEFLVSRGIHVRAFVIVKPPFVRTDSEAVNLARRSIDFAFNCGATIVSLIPARFGPDALRDLAKAGEFAPPSFEALEESLDYGIAQERGRMFADLWDIESLGGCCACMPERVARLREMNLRQVVLPHIICSHAETKCVPVG